MNCWTQFEKQAFIADDLLREQSKAAKIKPFCHCFVIMTQKMTDADETKCCWFGIFWKNWELSGKFFSGRKMQNQHLHTTRKEWWEMDKNIMADVVVVCSLGICMWKVQKHPFGKNITPPSLLKLRCSSFLDENVKRKGRVVIYCSIASVICSNVNVDRPVTFFGRKVDD